VKARSERNFSLADEIRDVIVAAGIDVMDTPAGSTWSIK
jgi:cysteinyl-tRNA synthetase